MSGCLAAGDEGQGQVADLFGQRRLVGVVAGQLVQQFLAQAVEVEATALAWMGQGDLDHLLDPPGARLHHHHPVGEKNRFVDIVGDQQRGDLCALADRQQFVLHLLASQRIEGAERFVQQQDARAGHQPPGNRHALGHATGELVRVGTGKVGEPYQLNEILDALLAFVIAQGLVDQAQADVFLDRQPGKQPVLLKHDAALAADAVDGPAVDADLALKGGVQADQQAQQGRLAATAGTDDGDEFAFGDVQAEIVDGLQFGAVDVEGLADLVEADQWCVHAFLQRVARVSRR